jgi:DNA-binding CsgD family transcriptional regulator
LAQGESPREIADRLGVSVGTLRIQLKAIFSKTGVRRQAELVRLLLLSPAGLADGMNA